MEPPDSRPSPWATEVHRGPGFVLGTFECPPEAPAWNEENWVGAHPHVVFPRTAVLIERRGAEFVCDPNTVVFYDANETFSRRLIDPSGDRCFYAELSEELVEEMLPGSAGAGRKLPGVTAPVDARVYALQWRTVRAFESDATAEWATALDEAILSVLGSIIAASASDAPGNDAGHRRIIESTKRVISETLDQQLSLAKIAALVHVSPYHLTRLFRRYTGMPLHRYRMQLRLRGALERLEGGRVPLREIAGSSGFASHSHFTARFRELFGSTPLQWRDERLDPCTLLALASGPAG